MRHPFDRVLYWESKIVELPDGRLLAVAWAYDEAAAKDLPNQYALSRDGGRTWSRPTSTGLLGQTLTPFVAGERVLCAYRRMDEPGLWIQSAHLRGDEWVNDDCRPLWGHNAAGLTGTSTSMAKNFQVLRFGAPCWARLPDGRLFVAFWCYEECVGLIRWFRFRL
jgi:hypothetical protein